jgi:hypothetical protein
MSNKNTKQLRRDARKAGKSGQSEYSIKLPTHGYHSDATMSVRTVPTARRGKDGVVSSNALRNTQQKVLQNGGGANSSLTVHEPINKSIPVIYKGHSYLVEDEHGNCQYKQLAGAR